MFKLLFKYKLYMALIILMMIIEPSLNSILNFRLQTLFTLASSQALTITIIRYLTIIFLLWLLKRIVSFSSSVFKNRYISHAKRQVKDQLFHSLLQRNSASLSQETSSGEYISLFTNDIHLLEQRYFDQVLSFISAIFSIVILGSSFIVLNKTLALGIISFGIISMMIPLIFSRILNESSLIYSKNISLFTQKLKEYFSAFSTIKNYSIEKEVEKRFKNINAQTENSKFEADYQMSLANNVGMLLSWFMQFIGVGIGIMMVAKGEITIPTVIAAQSFASDLANPMQTIVMNFNAIQSIKDIKKRLEELCSCDDKNESYDYSCNRCDITFDHLSIVKNGRKIVKDFNYTFVSGKKYLIVGVNGSGKSSIFKALKKWYEDIEGKIYINDMDISLIKSSSLSKIVSYLGEKVSLFSTSVKNNITLFREYDNHILDKAINQAHLNLDLYKRIEDDGKNFSTGEGKKIEICRSLFDDVNVLVFDEVVSTLDIETAYDIEKLALSFEDKTVIFVSHNFSGKLIREYDEILVMDQGSLQDSGTYDELIERCPYFKRICDIKFG